MCTVKNAGCGLWVPRSSVPSATPSRLLETFGASTYEGPSGRAGPSCSAQLITPRGRRTTATKKRRFKIQRRLKNSKQSRDSRHGLEDTGAVGSLGSLGPHVETSFSTCSGQNQTLCCEAPFFKYQYSPSPVPWSWLCIVDGS